ncbi:lytic transglycosylase domain-containing protein [Streptomyces sp. NPDC057101]|uniref:lytic transglycosylase domain-containing protein n=1 Tax=Streptomyces sp. NPDC057101 TaxID=3346020 RepID=UPI003635857B
MGLGIQKSSQPTAAAADAPDESGSQAVRRPFVTPSGTAIAPDVPPSAGGSPVQRTGDGIGLPTTVYHAYLNAQTLLATSQPTCRLTWPMLAGIGQVESNQARNGALDAAGDTVKPIVGPALNGDGFASIADTDGGRLDGDTRWDRAVGPMQFIPTTWAVWGTDGNRDGIASPHNMFDAALTTGRYLCANRRNLSDPKQLRDAILSYNRSSEYADTVTDWIARYTRAGADLVPDSSASASPSPSPSPSTKPSAGSSTRPSDGPRTSPSTSPTPKGSTRPSPTPSPSDRPSGPPPSPSTSTPPPPPPSPSTSTPPSSSPGAATAPGTASGTRQP